MNILTNSEIKKVAGGVQPYIRVSYNDTATAQKGDPYVSFLYFGSGVDIGTQREVYDLVRPVTVEIDSKMKTKSSARFKWKTEKFDA
ncbi:MAG: hypothetical protein KKE11_04475 [Gammaproteobacteria bacterium]|nr:hypothetical protein [Gammaproteobacteria bacterium]